MVALDAILFCGLELDVPQAVSCILYAPFEVKLWDEKTQGPFILVFKQPCTRNQGLTSHNFPTKDKEDFGSADLKPLGCVRIVNKYEPSWHQRQQNPACPNRKGFHGIYVHKNNVDRPLGVTLRAWRVQEAGYFAFPGFQNHPPPLLVQVVEYLTWPIPDSFSPPLPLWAQGCILCSFQGIPES